MIVSVSVSVSNIISYRYQWNPFLLIGIGISISEFVFFLSVSVSAFVIMRISVSVKWNFPYRSITRMNIEFCRNLAAKLAEYKTLIRFSETNIKPQNRNHYQYAWASKIRSSISVFVVQSATCGSSTQRIFPLVYFLISLILSCKLKGI